MNLKEINWKVQPNLNEKEWISMNWNGNWN